MLRRWTLWLPALYLFLLGLAALDMMLSFSGDGEANLGAWLYIFSFAPAMIVAQALGASMSFPPKDAAVLILLQALGLLLVGLIIDVVTARMRRLANG